MGPWKSFGKRESWLTLGWKGARMRNLGETGKSFLSIAKLSKPWSSGPAFCEKTSRLMD